MTLFNWSIFCTIWEYLVLRNGITGAFNSARPHLHHLFLMFLVRAQKLILCNICTRSDLKPPFIRFIWILKEIYLKTQPKRGTNLQWGRKWKLCFRWAKTWWSSTRQWWWEQDLARGTLQTMDGALQSHRWVRQLLHLSINFNQSSHSTCKISISIHILFLCLLSQKSECLGCSVWKALKS